MELFIFWFIISVLVGVFASSRRRNGLGWFFLSLIISPLIGFLILLVAGFPGDTLKKCPKCAEEVKIEAQVCRFCKYEFPLPQEKEKPQPMPMPKDEIDRLYSLREKMARRRYWS